MSPLVNQGAALVQEVAGAADADSQLGKVIDDPLDILGGEGDRQVLLLTVLALLAHVEASKGLDVTEKCAYSIPRNAQDVNTIGLL